MRGAGEERETRDTDDRLEADRTGQDRRRGEGESKLLARLTVIEETFQVVKDAGKRGHLLLVLEQLRQVVRTRHHDRRTGTISCLEEMRVHAAAAVAEAVAEAAAEGVAAADGVGVGTRSGGRRLDGADRTSEGTRGGGCSRRWDQVIDER